MQADHIKERMSEWTKNETRKAISHVKLEDEEKHERNIENMVQDNDYKLPWKIKYATVAIGYYNERFYEDRKSVHCSNP